MFMLMVMFMFMMMFVLMMMYVLMMMFMSMFMMTTIFFHNALFTFCSEFRCKGKQNSLQLGCKLLIRLNIQMTSRPGIRAAATLAVSDPRE